MGPQNQTPRRSPQRRSIPRDRPIRGAARARGPFLRRRLRTAAGLLTAFGIAAGMLGVYGTERDAPLLFALAAGGVLVGLLLQLLAWAAGRLGSDRGDIDL